MAIKIRGTELITDTFDWTQNFLPNTPNNLNLGSSSTPWNNLYIHGAISSSSAISILNGSAAQSLLTRGVYAGTNYSGNTPPDGAFDALNGYQVAGTTIIDASRNITPNTVVVTGSSYDEDAIRTTNGRMTLGTHASGAGIWIKTGGTHDWFTGADTQGRYRIYRNGDKLIVSTTGSLTITGEMTVPGNNIVGNLSSVDSRRVEINANNGQWAYTRLKSPSYLWDIAYKSTDLSGALQFRPNGNSANRMTLSKEGVLTAGTVRGVNGLAISNTETGTGEGLGLYGNLSGGGGTLPQYGMAFAGTATFGTHGSVTETWATYFTTSATDNRGWIWRAGTTSGTLGNVASLDKAGTFTTNGDVIAYASSDEKLKDNKKVITGALNKIDQLSGIEFDWNDNQTVYSGHDIGVVAQEVEKVFPELVTTREDGYKAVKYEKLVPVLIEAIKELKDIVKNGI